MAFYIKQNDTAPSFRSTLLDGNGSAVNLTNASVRFHMFSEMGAQVVDAAAVIINASTGIVQYNWLDGDTSATGWYRAEWEVTYQGGTVETFPSNSYLLVKITRELA